MDDVKEKSEARRRKILENSEKRLERITRVKYDHDSDITGKRNHTANRLPMVDQYESYVASTREDIPSAGIRENERLPDVSDGGEPTLKATPTILNGNIKIWKKLGFKLVVLAVIVRIVHIFKLGYLFGETIVIPFALFMMTQLGSCQFEQNTAGITGPILYFFGMSPTRIKNLLICYNVVSSILVYFGIYFFTFVCTHLTFVKLLDL